MTVTAPVSLSKINAEFGTKSLKTHFDDGDGGVGSAPGNMTEFEGTTADIAPTSVSATNAINNLTGVDSSRQVSATSVVSVLPGNATNLNYSWSKLSGTTISSSGSPNRVFTRFMNSGDFATASYRVTVSNSAGSVTDDITVTLSYEDIGS